MLNKYKLTKRIQPMQTESVLKVQKQLKSLHRFERINASE